MSIVPKHPVNFPDLSQANSLSLDVTPCTDLFMGYDTPPCPQPCETFHTQIKFVSELDAEDDNEMTIRMKFSPKVIGVMTLIYLQ